MSAGGTHGAHGVAVSGRPGAPTGTLAAVTSPRYRCGACGNLTRFDVVAERRTRAFHHYSVGGELTVEDEAVLAEHVVSVSCRWCGHGRAVVPLEAGAPATDPAPVPANDPATDPATDPVPAEP